MRYANIYICFFVLHLGFFQQPRGRVAPRLGRVPPIRQINCSLPTRINIDPIFMYLQVKASSLDLQMPTRGRVAPRLGRVPPSGRQIAVYLTYIHTFSEPLIYLSCFIFCYKVIEYQSFRKMKHTTLMFHF